MIALIPSPSSPITKSSKVATAPCKVLMSPSFVDTRLITPSIRPPKAVSAASNVVISVVKAKVLKSTVLITFLASPVPDSNLISFPSRTTFSALAQL
jgi:hypothetical protein